jgi:hypothetical protein
MIRLFTLLSLVVMLSLAGMASASPLTNSTAFLDKIDSDLKSGVIDLDQALLYKFHYSFDSSKLPEEYQVEGFSPLRCGTAAIMEYMEAKSHLRPETVAAIEAYLVPGNAKLAYNSPGGNFQLTYETSGTNAVPTADTNPPNGIPDYVEKVATYFDESWTAEVDNQGFTAPPLPSGRYAVSFESMSAYGYTTVVNYSGGQTRIVMHNTFNGFPGNDDPEGDVWGAAKVTAAHEFKHATQFATSRWSEGGWNEVDATWAEEFVYDQVNDYYNYLPGESPIRHPEISLDGGSTGTGSYDDCVWEIWMSETFGAQIITDYWNYRATHTAVTVMNSWEVILGDYGLSLAEGWSKFTAWNYGCGYRAVPGVGYDEADRYPYGTFVAYTTTYPFTTNATVEHLAANQVRLLGFDGATNGTLEVDFSGTAGGSMTLAAYVEKFDGSGAIEVATLDASNNGHFILSTPLQDIKYAGLIVGNATKSGSAMAWALTVNQVEALPQPEMQLDAAFIAATLEEGSTATEYLALSNVGEAGSTLDFNAAIWGHEPMAKNAGDKSVAGSTVTPDSYSYLSGYTVEMEFTVYNGSPDDEWLTDVSLDFPAGVTVNSSMDFMGGSYGDLLSNDATGDGVKIDWHGTYGPNNYGVVISGESVTASVTFTIDPGFSGDLEIATSVGGDGYGQNPHTVTGTIVLAPGNPEMNVSSPNGGEVYSSNESVTVSWLTGGMVAEVDIELSRDGGDVWETLASGVVNTGSHALSLGGPGSNNCLIRVSGTGGTPADVSDAGFVIYAPVSWLACTPASGSVNEGQEVSLALDFTPGSLMAETYMAYLVVGGDGPVGSTVVPVTMTVTAGTSAATTPMAFALNGNFPNPFNPQTAINFSLAKEGVTTIEVLDVRGHLVAKLFQGNLESGHHTVDWDGRDADGRIVAAGTYLARLRTNGHEAVSKMVLAK